MTSAEILAILTGPQVECKTFLASNERDQVRELLIHPGFMALLGMMLGEQQSILRQLQNIRVGDMAAAQHLGVLQGRSLAVDIVRQNVIDCLAVPADKED